MTYLENRQYQYRPDPIHWIRAVLVLADNETGAYAYFSDAMSMT